MTSLVKKEKRCSKCGETAPLSEFSRDKNRPDGRSYWCKKCDRAQTAAYQKAKREEMGDEAWREYCRQNVARYRATTAGRAKARLDSRIQTKALAVLRDNHYAEYEALLKRIRYEMEATA